jgi:hypothetical protein
MNTEKLLSLAFQAKINPSCIDEIIRMANQELEAELSKKTGKKNRYDAILKMFKYIKKVRSDDFAGIYRGNDGKWYITDGYGIARWNDDFDTKDLRVWDNGPKHATAVLDDCKKQSTVEVELPSEKDLLLSFKKQKAEKDFSNYYHIYVKIGSNYYDPQKLANFLSVMGNNFVAKNGPKSIYIQDEAGNECILMGLDPTVIIPKE